MNSRRSRRNKVPRQVAGRRGKRVLGAPPAPPAPLAKVSFRFSPKPYLLDPHRCQPRHWLRLGRTGVPTGVLTRTCNAPSRINVETPTRGRTGAGFFPRGLSIKASRLFSLVEEGNQTLSNTAAVSLAIMDWARGTSASPYWYNPTSRTLPVNSPWIAALRASFTDLKPGTKR